MEGLGPFSGEPSGLLPLRVSSRRFQGPLALSGRADPEVLAHFHRARVSSRAQVSLAVPGSAGAVKRLHLAGYLLKLETGRTPPLYAISSAASGRGEIYDALSVLKLAASCQLYLCLRYFWREVDYRAGVHPLFVSRLCFSGVSYWVLCPRVWPGELDSASQDLECVPEGERVIAVCGSKDLASELARISRPSCMVRYVWDKALVPGGPVALYAAYGRSLIEAEKISGNPLDSSRRDGVS